MPTLTRADQELANAVLQSRPGQTIKKKFESMIRDASRNRKTKLSKYDFLKAPEKVQRMADIVGFDDGKNSKLATHNRGRKSVIKEELKIAKKENNRKQKTLKRKIAKWRSEQEPNNKRRRTEILGNKRSMDVDEYEMAGPSKRKRT